MAERSFTCGSEDDPLQAGLTAYAKATASLAEAFGAGGRPKAESPFPYPGGSPPRYAEMLRMSSSVNCITGLVMSGASGPFLVPSLKRCS